MADIMVKTVTLTEREWQLIIDSLKYDIANYQDERMKDKYRKVLTQIEDVPSRKWLEPERVKSRMYHYIEAYWLTNREYLTTDEIAELKQLLEDLK